MFSRRATASFLAGLCISVGILALNACGGGGGPSVFNPPLPKGGQDRTSASASIPLSNVGNTISLPAVGSYTESITLPDNTNHSATLHLTISTLVPNAMPAMDPNMHVAKPYIYITLTASQTVTLKGFPKFTITIPAGELGAAPVKIGFYDPAKGWQRIGDLVQTGDTWTFSGNLTSITLTANTTYFAVPYSCSGPSPSPSPVPTGTCTTVPVTGGATVNLPSIGGFGGQFTYPANNAPSGTTETLTSFDREPPNAPLPQASSNGFHRYTLRPPVGFWVSFTFSKSSTSASTSSFTFNSYPPTEWDLPEGFPTAGMTFYLETFDGHTLLDTETASTVSSTTVTFPGAAKTLTAIFGHRYWWELISTPSVTEYALATGAAPTDIKLGPDGNLWFGEAGRGDLGRITPRGSITEFPLPTAAGTFVRRITVGPDGNLWFTIDHSGGFVGRSTPAGVISTFALPTGGTPIGITTGSDGNLWVVDAFNGNLDRVTPSGVITQFSTFTSADSPFGDVSGPDGNLWVTLLNTNEIAKVNISTQAVTRFPIPTASSLPNYIITHGGSMYFEENNANKIGVITTGGTISEIPLVQPLPPSYPGWLTNGPDGNVWFCDQGAGEVGSIVSGKTVEFPVPTPSSLPVGITNGPGNTIWFTENGTDKIGTFTVP